MKKIIQLAGFIGVFAFGTLNAQIYLTEGFENPFTGNPGAPTGWTQSRLVLIGDGIPEPATTTGEKDWERNVNTGPATWSTVASSGVYPTAAATGSAALFMNDANFGFNGLGNRRVETPVVNLGASTNPYVKFKMFYSSTANNLQFRVMASNNGGTTWAPIMSVYPNSGIVGVMTSATPWESINVRIPAIYKVANAKFALEFTPSNGFNNLLFVDDFSVEEFTPTTITSAGSGAWSLPATWVGGVVPNANNNVVIALGHTVTMDMNVERAQNLTLDGGLTYSTTTTAHVLQVLNNFSISATGSYTSGTGTTGKRTYIGSSFNNLGVADFDNGTSTSGGLFWTGYTGSYSGTGTLTNGRIPVVSHICAGGVQYLNPVTVSNIIDLILGTVNVTNLTLGNPSFSTSFTTNKAFGSFSGLPTINNTNITSRNLNYVTAYATNNVYYVQAPQTLIPGDEIEIISGTRQVTGFLGMNTYNNISLNYPLLVGTTTTGGLTLTRGIIITTTTNILTLNSFGTGAVGTIPSTLTTGGTVAGNHGSFISGPVRIFFPPNVNTTNRNFPLGVGTAFHNNLPSANLRRFLTLGSGGLAWSSQTITATIENAPSGAVNPTLTTVMGSRAYRLNMNGGPGLGLNNTVLLNFDNTTFGPTDNLFGSNQDLRIAQAPALNGPWTERSLTTGTGLIAQNAPSTRITTSLAPGPIINGDEYFAWTSTSPAIDLSAISLSSPASLGCYGPNQTVSFVITNAGVAPLNFVTNNATITSSVSGAANQVFAPVIINTGVLAVGASQTVVVTTTLNMSTVGTYSFYSTVSTPGDLNLTNDIMTVATRSVIAPSPIPQFVDFTGYTGSNLPTPFPLWTEGTSSVVPTGTISNWTSQTALNSATNVNARVFLSAITTNEWIVGPKFTATANTNISFDAALTLNTVNPFTPATMGSDDKIRVMVSTNCGVSFTPIFTISATNSLSTTFTNYIVNLGAYAGQDIIVAFLAQDGPVDDIEAYYFHLDNINLYNGSPADAGVSSFVSPTSGCFGSAEPVIVNVTNFGTAAISNFSVTAWVSGAVTQTFVANYTGTLAVSASGTINLGTLNMTPSGQYTFKGFTSLAGDGNNLNDTNIVFKTSLPIISFPQSVNFTGYTGANLPTVFPNWNEGIGAAVPSGTTSNWLSFTGLNGPGNITARVQLFGTTRNEWITSPRMTATANSQISFDAAVTDIAGTGPSLMGSDDKVRVMVSTNCGVSFTPIFTISATNSLSTTFTNYVINLSAYAGQDIVVALLAQDGPVDDIESYYFHLDNINLYNASAADGGVSAINSPTPNACLGTAEPIVVTLNNYGTAAISNFSVTANINGPLNTTLVANYTGTIAPSATAVFTVGTANMNAAGVYTINAFTTLVGDPNAFNNASVVTRTQSPSFNISGNTNICTSGTASLNIIGAAVSYTWSTGSNASSITVTPSVTTSYSAIGTGTNGCQVSAFSTVTVSNPTITGLGTAVCGTTAVGTLTANGFAPVTWYATSTPTNPLATGNTFTAIAATTTTYYAQANSTNNGSIATTYTAGNGSSGNMFDVTALNAITINSVDVVISSVAVSNIEVWYRIGSFVGFESSNAGWTSAGTGTVMGAGNGNPVPLNVNLGINIPAGQTYGIYVTSNGGGSFGYSNGTAVGNLYSQNADLNVFEGKGGSYFGVTIATRIWNGNIHYTKQGCTSPIIPVTLTVTSSPAITIASSQPSVCPNNSVTIGVTGATTYTWSTGGNGASIVATPSVSTVYTVTGETSPGCSGTASITIGTLTVPVVNVTSSASLICIGQTASLTASGANTYVWNTSSTNTVIAVSPTVNTTYTVTGTGSNTCVKSTVFTQSVSACTGVDENNSFSNLINVYPNPSNGIITTEFNFEGEKEIVITNSVGQLIKVIKTNNNSEVINLEQNAKGMYFVKVSTKVNSVNYRIIIQ